MTSKKKRILAISILVLAITAVACNIPAASLVGSQPGAEYTQAAKTIMAQLTYSVVETFVYQKTLEAMATSTPAATNTPLPTSTPLPTIVPPTATKTTVPPTSTAVPVPCDWAQYVKDVTIDDGDIIPAGEGFYKIWRLKNIGVCTWTTDYDLIFAYGDRMAGEKAIPLTYDVAPGETIDVAVYLQAPTKKGEYKGFWKLRNDSGYAFGIGGDYNTAFWVDITVKGSVTAFDTPYNFFDDFCVAEWSNHSNVLPCPGNSASTAGYVIYLKNPVLEVGGKDDEPALWVHPQFIKNGSITGKYPPILIKDGDYFASVVGCLKDATGCDVKFTLSYSADGGPITTLGTWHETYDKKITHINIDLSSLKDQKVVFYFTVDANGTYKGDDAFWLAPAIKH